MQAKKPLCYIAVVRTYNSMATLRSCLTSIEAQSILPKQVIVVDSGSRDDTIRIAKQHECSVIQYPNNEPFNYSKALNMGIAASTSDYILILSSHCALVERDAVEAMLAIVSKEGIFGVWCTHAWSRASVVSGNEGSLIWTPLNLSNFSGNNSLRNSCCVIRRNAWLIHHFDEEIPAAEDQEFALWHYRHTGLSTAFLHNRQVLHENLRANAYKQIRDIVLVAERWYPVWRSPLKIARHFAGGCASILCGRLIKGTYQVRLAVALGKSWFSKSRFISRYY